MPSGTFLKEVEYETDIRCFFNKEIIASVITPGSSTVRGTCFPLHTALVSVSECALEVCRMRKIYSIAMVIQ